MCISLRALAMLVTWVSDDGGGGGGCVGGGYYGGCVLCKYAADFNVFINV